MVYIHTCSHSQVAIQDLVVLWFQTLKPQAASPGDLHGFFWGSIRVLRSSLGVVYASTRVLYYEDSLGIAVCDEDGYVQGHRLLPGGGAIDVC